MVNGSTHGKDQGYQAAQSSPTTSLELYLHERDDRSWRRIADLLDAEMHLVDRTAARVCLSFFPIALSGLPPRAT